MLAFYTLELSKTFWIIMMFFQTACCLNIWLCPLVSFLLQKKKLCVRSLGYIMGACAYPPFENMCVRLLGYIVGASPLVCVLSLEDNLRWILACCLLRFAAFLYVKLQIILVTSKFLSLSISFISGGCQNNTHTRIQLRI